MIHHANSLETWHVITHIYTIIYRQGLLLPRQPDLIHVLLLVRNKIKLDNRIERYAQACSQKTSLNTSHKNFIIKRSVHKHQTKNHNTNLFVYID